ncbi:hypothetical protein [Diaphorobacter sp. ED-3]|uniref:hypothetical protein n=1 Tax=Diaphorobacter sp. ED-3 TaxID=3016636 RepID=UPI0022DE27AA|nr:hypothetical protein [Diaphorobacter sp. ED-3]
MAERKPVVLVGGVLKEMPSGDALPAANIPEVTAPNIHAAPAKPTPADADELGYVDSAAGWGLVKLTWANLKTALSNIFLPKTGGRVADSDINPGAVEVGIYGSGDRPAYIDLHAYGAPLEVDYSARIIRNGGPNGELSIFQNGTSPVAFYASGGILSNVGPIGYGVGNGGTAVQAKSNTTPVPINKQNGVIYLANGSIPGSGIIVFELQNTFITANSIVVVHGSYIDTGTGSGSAISQFTPQVNYVQAGIAVVQIKNNYAGTIPTDGVTIRFAVFAGSAS